MSQSTLKPFHESIVDAIHRMDGIPAAMAISALIKETAIPKGHDAIVDAWREEIEKIPCAGNYGVPGSVLAQKKAAEAKPKSCGGGEVF